MSEKESNEKKKYEKPELNGLDDTDGEVVDKDMEDVSGGGAWMPDDCSAGGSPGGVCNSGFQAINMGPGD